MTLADVSFDAGPAIVTRLVLGNLLVAVVLTAVGYVGALRFVHEYRRREARFGDFLSERLSE
ncbi:hypothetical protein [Halalkalicoccus jeotgali]|uniref:Uncharacterized protein n=1 Tax=Halalkalicoccus jeotgali (strain DSM 18796 / CECT 7217 / JCM 14584 / KCTC 4019 / B3) TaxID=795797 RepID=D8J883_HALJB|nr:hypothetical protein HacjB3_04025 [Halalkalicoccus jeotgali B3]ELY34622.1 hypothetical protein C497_15268 [Halalkalicoccus jeotgali B3]